MAAAAEMKTTRPRCASPATLGGLVLDTTIS